MSCCADLCIRTSTHCTSDRCNAYDCCCHCGNKLYLSNGRTGPDGGNWAEKILRKNPHHITFTKPVCDLLFYLFAGTGHVAYSVLPVIAEVAKDTGIRPERPLVSQLSLRSRLLLPARYRQQRLLCSVCLPDITFSLFDILKISISLYAG